MRGTLVCAVTHGEESQNALALGAELSERLGLRLVLAHAVDGVADANGNETLTMKQDREAAERHLARLADAHGVGHRAEKRVAVGGDAAGLFARVAAEEAADAIVVGARARGWHKRLESRLAHQLEAETPVPVLIALPRVCREKYRRL